MPICWDPAHRKILCEYLHNISGITSKITMSGTERASKTFPRKRPRPSKTLNWTPCGTGTMKKRLFVFISAVALNSHVIERVAEHAVNESRTHYRGASTCTPTSQTDSPRSRRLQSFVTLAAHRGVRRVRRQHPLRPDRADQIRRGNRRSTRSDRAIANPLTTWSITSIMPLIRP